MTARDFHPRDIAERILLRCDLVLQEAAHLGGADPDATSDRPLLRDADGRIYLAGTALKGVLRRGGAHQRLLGGEAQQARLLVDDAPLRGAECTDLREGVAIDPGLGIAADQRRYDIEVLAKGSVFTARFEALVPHADQDGFLVDLCALLDRLTDGVAVGARTRRGFGLIRREGPWFVRRYSGMAGLRAWLAEGWQDAPASWRGPPAEDRFEDLWVGLNADRAPAPSSDEVEIALELQIVGALLIRSAVNGAGPADVAQLHARAADGSARPVVSGTSLAGALRARCLRIARTLLGENRSKTLVDDLFGPAEIQNGQGRASRLRVGETAIEGGAALRHTRVRIDPWTGGASDARLFTAEPIYGGTLCPRLRWRPDDRCEGAERALLLLALRDLALGDLPIGGEIGTGRGRLAPRHADGTFGRFGAIPLQLTTAGGLAGDFNADLRALQEYGHG